MKIDLTHLDEQISLMLQEQHSKCFLEGFVARNAKSLESLDDVREIAAFYGDSQRFAKLMQLIFVRTLLKHSKGKGEWAMAALEHMDQLVALRQEAKGLCTPKRFAFQSDETDEVGGC